jgi:Arylsulfotransferase (ASST)
MEQQGLTRREMLERGIAVMGAGGLALAGLTGSAWPGDKAAAATLPASPAAPDAGSGVRHFVSRPDLTPPNVTLTHHGPAATSTAGDPPYFVLTPSAGPGTPGLMILDRAGGLVWYSPNSQRTARLDLKVQSYQGKPVLTWWEGQILAGYGQGRVVIADSSYRTIATVNAGHGLTADLHEMVISPQNTALITVYKPVTTNLSRLGGPAKGVALSGVVQEIDIPSGRVLFEWSSIDHVPVTDTVVSFAGGTSKAPFDYFHINSISIAPDGTLLISARNTSTVYKIARPSGKVVWQLGGRRSSFRMGPGTRFWFQHHALPQGANTLSIFDDGGAPPKEPQSRGILVNLNTSTMRATLQRSYIHPTTRLLAAFEGSMQVLPGGRVLIGWGNLPYFSEFTANGTLILDGQYPAGDQSYRVLSAAWTGQPADQPAAAARVSPTGGSVVYASWNGATRVDSWTVLAGRSPSGLAQAGSRGSHGFETAITVNNLGPYFAVTANDASGQPLGQSPAILLAK